MCLCRLGCYISRSEVVVNEESWLDTCKTYSLLSVVDLDESDVVFDFHKAERTGIARAEACGRNVLYPHVGCVTKVARDERFVRMRC